MAGEEVRRLSPLRPGGRRGTLRPTLPRISSSSASGRAAAETTRPWPVSTPAPPSTRSRSHSLTATRRPVKDGGMRTPGRSPGGRGGIQVPGSPTGTSPTMAGRTRRAAVNREMRSMQADLTSGASWKAGRDSTSQRRKSGRSSPNREASRTITPFCAATEVERWPGTGSRDSITYHSGIRYQRNFVSWQEGVGYDIELGESAPIRQRGYCGESNQPLRRPVACRSKSFPC